MFEQALVGLPLARLNLSYCYKLTDSAEEHLRKLCLLDRLSVVGCHRMSEWCQAELQA